MAVNFKKLCQGNPEAALSIVEEVLNKQAEIFAALNEERLANLDLTLAKALEVGLVIKNPDGSFTFLNKDILFIDL